MLQKLETELKLRGSSDYTVKTYKFYNQKFLDYINKQPEQIEEEALARTILDKINLIGNDKGGLYLFDRDVQQITVESAASDTAE